MSHQPRLHAAGAFYYVIQRCCSGRQLLLKDEDYSELSAAFPSWIKKYRIRIHAFLWLPTEIHLIVQVNDVPLSQFMRSLTQMFTYRQADQEREDELPLFSERYSAVLFDPEDFLLKGVRCMHSGAMCQASDIQLREYEWCSDRAYRGQARLPWLTTFAALGQFNRHTVRGQRAYARFMEEAPTEDDIVAFGTVTELERRVLGSSIFVHRMGLKITPWRRIDVAQEIKAISERLGADLEEVCSRSRGKEITEIRAAIAHELKRHKWPSQAAAARFMGRCPSTLNEIAANHSPSAAVNLPVMHPRPMGAVLSPREITSMLAMPAWSASR